MFYYRILTIFIVLILNFFFILTSFAYDGITHISDMLLVLGFDNSQSRTEAYKNAKEVASYITSRMDKCQSLCDKIRKVEPNFSEGPARHRCFFHWGFNSDPMKSEYLKRQIDKSVQKENHYRIKELILNEQADRNREMMNILHCYFGKNSKLMLTRSERNALASFMYNIHLLGDYESSKKGQDEPLPSLNRIIDDTIRSVNGRIYESDSKLVSTFRSEMENLKLKPDSAEKASMIHKK
jgi:hypothetical protein